MLEKALFDIQNIFFSFPQIPILNQLPFIGNGEPIQQFDRARQYCNQQYQPERNHVERYLYGYQDAREEPYFEAENLKLYAICVIEQQNIMDQSGQLMDDPFSGAGVFGQIFGGYMDAQLYEAYNRCQYIQAKTLIDQKYLRALCLSRLFRGGRIF